MALLRLTSLAMLLLAPKFIKTARILTGGIGAVTPRELAGLTIEKLGDNAKITLEVPPASVIVLKVAA